MKGIRKSKVFAMIISAAMILQPLASATAVYATEPDVSAEVT